MKSALHPVSLGITLTCCASEDGCTSIDYCYCIYCFWSI